MIQEAFWSTVRLGVMCQEIATQPPPPAITVLYNVKQCISTTSTSNCRKGTSGDGDYCRMPCCDQRSPLHHHAVTDSIIANIDADE